MTTTVELPQSRTFELPDWEVACDLDFEHPDVQPPARWVSLTQPCGCVGLVCQFCYEVHQRNSWHDALWACGSCQQDLGQGYLAMFLSFRPL